jgi:hypothetical protein
MGSLFTLFVLVLVGSVFYYFAPLESAFSPWLKRAVKSLPVKLLLYCFLSVPALSWAAAILFAFLSSWVWGVLVSAVVIFLWIRLTPIPAEYPETTPIQQEFGPELGRYLSEMVDGGLITMEEPEGNSLDWAPQKAA